MFFKKFDFVYVFFQKYFYLFQDKHHFILKFILTNFRFFYSFDFNLSKLFYFSFLNRFSQEISSLK